MCIIPMRVYIYKLVYIYIPMHVYMYKHIVSSGHCALYGEISSFQSRINRGSKKVLVVLVTCLLSILYKCYLECELNLGIICLNTGNILF